MAPVLSKFEIKLESVHDPDDCFLCLNQYNDTNNKRIQICNNNHGCCEPCRIELSNRFIVDKVGIENLNMVK